MRQELQNIFSLNYDPTAFDDKEKEVRRLLNLVKECSSEKELVNFATETKFDIRVRVAAAEKVKTFSHLEHLLWQAFIQSSLANCTVTVIAAKKLNVNDMKNHALRPVLMTVNLYGFHDLIEEAIPLVSDVNLLEEFINLAKRFSPKLEQLAYERAMELL
ncbi:MAG: hypothetical protein IKK43_03620 [Clostridia bacterium]|nr:hypothetical protein [Clostridia bacterium]